MSVRYPPEEVPLILGEGALNQGRVFVGKSGLHTHVSPWQRGVIPHQADP